MAHADEPSAVRSGGPTVHNGGSVPVSVRVLVRGRAVSATTVELAPGETAPVPASPAESVEIHADGGSAAAPAGTDPAFVVREGSVLVAPE